MSRDRYRGQEDWEDEEDSDFDEYEEEEEEYRKPGSRNPAWGAGNPIYRGTRRSKGRDESRPYEGQRRRRGSWPCLLIGCASGMLLAVLLAVAGVFVAADTGSTQISHLVPALPVPGGSSGDSSNASMFTQKSQQTLQLATIAQMQVHNQVGDISITVDPGVSTPTVTIVKMVQATSNADAQKEFGRISAQVQADSTTNTLVVSVILPDTSSAILSKNSDAVDVAITLPPGVVSTGVINHAPTQLTLNADTSVGNVLINGLNGVLVVKDSFGNVTVHKATLADGSHLETGTGDVVFDGALNLTGTANPQPMFKIQAEKGNVDVTLPATTNVTLDANINVGSIKSDFPITISNSGGSPSYYGPLMGGATPTAVLVLDVSSGNIDLHEA